MIRTGALRFAAILLCLSLAASARAEDDAAAARTLYDRGMAHFRLEEYDQAIEKFEAGFRLRPAPEFLYNIAQAYRLTKRNEKARSFYKKYLLMDPEAPNKAQVLKHIAALDKAIEAEQRAANAPPSDAMPSSSVSRTPSASSSSAAREPAPTPTPPPPSEPPPSSVSPPPASSSAPPASNATANESLVASAPPRRDTRPVYKKAWFWGVVGGGVVVVGAAVLIGVLVTSSGSSRDTIPAARF
jgi:tetratricopeptide (TPR) repeat protein